MGGAKLASFKYKNLNIWLDGMIGEIYTSNINTTITQNRTSIVQNDVEKGNERSLVATKVWLLKVNA